jgi:hypothetical protein
MGRQEWYIYLVTIREQKYIPPTDGNLNLRGVISLGAVSGPVKDEDDSGVAREVQCM